MSRARLVARVLGAVWLVAGGATLVAPSSWVPADVVNNDGVAHAVAFAVAVALWTVGLPRRGLWVVGVALALAGASEVVQAVLSPGRESQWSDVGANVVGIVAGLAAGLAMSRAVDGWERWAPGASASRRTGARRPRRGAGSRPRG